MLIHPSVLLDLANDRNREMIADAERGRLLASAARRVRTGWARKGGAVRGQPTGTLATCEASVAVPAR